MQVISNRPAAHSRKERSGLRLLALAALHAFALGFVSQAHAVDFEEGVAAIRAKVDSLPSKVREANFWDQVTPIQWTPDQGVYAFYSGSKGSGAVYWSEQTGAHVVYGAILGYWESQGYEFRLGYPTNDEQGKTDRDDCPKGTKRAQSFGKFATGTHSGPVGACWVDLCWTGSTVVESNPTCS